MEHFTFPESQIPQAYGPYSHAVMAGDYVFISGQTGRDPKTAQVIEGDVYAQTIRMIEIVQGILAELGLTLRDVVRTTVFLHDINDFVEMNRAYASMFQAPYPARSTFQVVLPKDALVGIETTAYRGKSASESVV